jgi:hypothetical protein
MIVIIRIAANFIFVQNYQPPENHLEKIEACIVTTPLKLASVFSALGFYCQVAGAICGSAPLSGIGGLSALQAESYRNCVENERFYRNQFSLGRADTDSLLKPLMKRGSNNSTDGSKDSSALQDATGDMAILESRPLALP